jgi:hypothetical protein
LNLVIHHRHTEDTKKNELNVSLSVSSVSLW